MQTTPRSIRYQAAIVQDHQVLLVHVLRLNARRSFWVLPGGGMEPGESETECLLREVREETGLRVEIERLLTDEAMPSHSYYQRRKTYLCRMQPGAVPAPGYEPEVEFDLQITDVGWFDLRDPSGWPAEARQDALTVSALESIRISLGYSAG
jgi:8-oxo-dGTP diphosphatase